MSLSAFWYSIKQGVINICRHSLFSLASIATISACIFLFCLFFSIIANVQYVIKNAESTVGITVFFDGNLTEEQIQSIGKQISEKEQIKTINYISAEEAWETFKQEYFAENIALAKGFEADNPLANSASFEIFLNNIESQPEIVTYLQEITGIREVNYSNVAAAGLSSFNKMIGGLSLVIIGVLLAVSTFLISNTVSVAAAFRKQENQIMKLIGATNSMVRAPYIVEGAIIGLIGAVLPLIGMHVLYQGSIWYLMERFQNLSGIFQFLPIERIFPYMASVALVLGVGIGFSGSFFTIRKHLRV